MYWGQGDGRVLAPQQEQLGGAEENQGSQSFLLQIFISPRVIYWGKKKRPEGFFWKTLHVRASAEDLQCSLALQESLRSPVVICEHVCDPVMKPFFVTETPKPL